MTSAAESKGKKPDEASHEKTGDKQNENQGNLEYDFHSLPNNFVHLNSVELQAALERGSTY
ncbi:MAG TPA: hypothetical protein VL357_05345 [Rariglobus sp.]|nr:hypothetical protein [Rariglobus sp.]